MNPENRRRAVLTELGLGPIWTLRTPVPNDDLPLAEPSLPRFPDADAQSALMTVDSASRAVLANLQPMDWDVLEDTIAGCGSCGRCASRSVAVPGAGDRKARWLFVGHGPGPEDDLQGLPFAGASGPLLDRMLVAIGLRRDENVFITHALKCRGVGADGHERVATVEEIAACRPFLKRQIELMQPSVIVALGDAAAGALLDLPAQITPGEIRNKVHQYGSIPLVVSFDPDHLLRTPSDKAQAWRDLCLAAQAHDAVA